MELRSMFTGIFGTIKDKIGLQRAKLLNGYSNSYSPWSGNAYDNIDVRDCIDVIARHVGKLRAIHIARKKGNIINTPDDPLNYLLGIRPNWLMTSSEFLEKITAQYYLENNIFVYIQRDEIGKIIAFWPLQYSNVELYEDNQGNLYTKFTFGNGDRAVVPYDEMIHIRRHYNRDEVFGDPCNIVLTEDLNLLRAVKIAIINAVKNGGKLRGILNWVGTVRPEDQKRLWQTFVDSYLTNKNGSGVGTLDNRATFQQITTDIETFDKGRMTFARDNIYKHFGVNEKIVMGQYTEDEYQSFYESVIEPFAVKLSQEFTEKVFTQKQRGFGNEIMFETNRLNYMTIASKLKLCQAMIPAGAIKRNEIRELFGYSGLPGKEGEEIVVSLNFVKTKDQSKYQTGTDDNKGGDDDEGIQNA